ncbi:response regulator [Neorickettsia helminthoeca str. Oregon]|uniref:histidine kinase n=1 Tax=Neorickettsia helminthoeca str. Oregon TaxID=1286528 RepID=X5GW48_9RICK|nr:response regulator [Neorickettsia helminthoeca str. Oregon]
MLLGEFDATSFLQSDQVRVVCYCVAVLTFFSLVYNLKKLHLVLVAAEFQNMFYSNAAKALTAFYMIITGEGELVYKDERTKANELKDVLGEKYDAVMSGIKEGVLYHRFHNGSEVIEIIPMMRPNGYLLITAKETSEEKIYDSLLDEAGISMYKVTGISVQNRGKSCLEAIGGKNVFLKEGLYKFPTIHSVNAHSHNLFFRNYSTRIDGKYYGIIMPKLVEISELASNTAIGVAFMTKDLKVLDVNDAFREVFGGKCNLEQFFRSKINDLSIDSSPSIANLTLDSGDSVRAYLSDYYGIIVGFFIDLTELSDLQKKFQHSQKIVSLGELSGGIAHDFNNILTAILGFAEMLLDDVPLKSKHYYDIAQIKYSAKKGQALVEKILAFSRNQTLHAEVLNVNDVVKSMRQLMERLVPENIKLSFRASPNLKNVKVDKTQLEQSLMNLVVNARDALESGGAIVVEVRNVLVDKKRTVLVGSQNEEVVLKGEYVSVTVEDNGSGISMDVLPKIFNPFFSTKSVDKGTGLGLSTVYGIIKQMRGYINVESIEKQGSTFTLLIPVSYETFVKKEEKIQDELIPSAASSGATILLVEDEKMVRNFLVKALRKQSFNVVECESSQVALKTFLEMKQRIELVITDIVMPGIDGPEMVTAMREDKPNLKVLFMSGYTRDKLHLDDHNHNEDFIAKPFEVNELISKIMKLIDNENSVV